MTEPGRALELLNVKLDVWIDEEHYSKVYKALKIRTKDELAMKVDGVIEAATHRGERVDIEAARSSFREILGASPSNWFRVTDIETERTFSSKEAGEWQPLFLAKRFRARAMENGADTWMALLDDIVLFLQKNLPVLFPDTPAGEVLRHLYFQELAACAKPGYESLGYATTAFDLLPKLGRNAPAAEAFALYKLWGKLNEGIGHWHSSRRMKAALCFNEIVREFDGAAKGLSSEERSYWSRLILEQALLNRAELQEALQFSFHSLKTLQKLGDGKPEHRLIKEALAYRDMRRLPEAEDKMLELFSHAGGQSSRPSKLTIKRTLALFQKWGKTAGPGIWTKAAGLVFDYCLEKLEDYKEKLKDDKRNLTKDILINEVSALTSGFVRHRPKLAKSKPERASYFQLVARYLRWLADMYKDFHSPSFKSEVDKLYAFICVDVDELGNSGLNGDIDLKEFNQYDYNRFSESMEKFFKTYNQETDFLVLDGEIRFLNALNDFESKQSYLYEFKKLERDQRIEVIEGIKLNGPPRECSDIGKCFNATADCLKFSGVLQCSRSFSDPIPSVSLSDYLDTGFTPLIGQDYEKIMKAENSLFLEYLKFRSAHELTDSGPKSRRDNSSDNYRSCHFLGLQRWNSQTPTLTLSLGGGYLLYEQDENGSVTLGIAIDPGFDFVHNLFHMGFTLQDIDFILITHAHLDHIRDFEPIVSAMLDLSKRDKTQNVKGKIHAIMSLGVYHKLESIIVNTTLREFLADTYIVDIEREVCGPDESFLFPFRFALQKTKDSKAKYGKYVSVVEETDKEYEIEIIPTKAYHEDYSDRSDSFGYIINRRLNGKRAFSFGYTGDTKWHEHLLEQYSACEVLCIHLGALIESEDSSNEKNEFRYYKGPQCDELLRKKGHPYLFGLLRFLKEINERDYRQKLLLLSEFGEELKGGIRIDLIHRINKILEAGKRQCLPVDIGLNVKLAESKSSKNQDQYEVRCFGCNNFVKVNDIRFRHFGYGRRDEGLFYFCSTCLKSKPENIIQERMRQLSELGITLQKMAP